MHCKASLVAYGVMQDVDPGTLFPYVPVLEHRRLGRHVARALCRGPCGCESRPWLTSTSR